MERCGSIGSGVVVTEVDKGECCLGFWVELEVFKADVIDKGQVHGREGRDGYRFLGEI